MKRLCVLGCLAMVGWPLLLAGLDTATVAAPSKALPAAGWQAHHAAGTKARAVGYDGEAFWRSWYGPKLDCPHSLLNWRLSCPCSLLNQALACPDERLCCRLRTLKQMLCERGRWG